MPIEDRDAVSAAAERIYTEEGLRSQEHDGSPPADGILLEADTYMELEGLMKDIVKWLGAPATEVPLQNYVDGSWESWWGDVRRERIREAAYRHYARLAMRRNRPDGAPRTARDLGLESGTSTGGKDATDR